MSEEIAFAGAARQAEMVRAGEVSPSELVRLCLERIERLDPQLNCFRVVLAERALLEAEQAEARLKAGEERPLLGVPIALKDDSDIVGELSLFGTTADDRPAAADSEVIRRLREAGALVVGITNAPELLMWPFAESLSNGATRNPWNLGRTPGGSSGGSGAAVAAGLVPIALGSDGAGSIRIPSACCGIFGIKPQRDRISTAPHTDADHTWHGLAVYGPLARRVADAAVFLDATAQEGAGTFLDAAKRDPGPLRVAVSTQPPPPARVGPEALTAVEETAALLRSLGHRVEQHRVPWLRAMPHVLVRYLRGARESGRALPHPERFEPRTKGMMRLGDLVPDRALAWSRSREAALTAELGAVFEQADVLLTPVLAGPATEVGRWAGRGALWTLNGASRLTLQPMLGTWNVTGQPAAAVPAGFAADGMPLAVQIVGRPGDEATLLSLAAQLEAERPWADKRPPIS
jgi:amidase